jgi:protein involved in polysaccharide export with SLBB domain
MIRRTALLLALLPLALTGCAVPYAATTDGLGRHAELTRLPFGAQTSQGRLMASVGIDTPYASDLPLQLPMLSAGDRVALVLEDGEEFSGSYAVGLDGQLRIPYLSPVPVSGLTVAAARTKIADAFIAEGILTPQASVVSLVPLLWAAVQVNVSGAVNAPGPVIINDRTHVETRPDLKTRSGDLAPDRYLTAALRAAGGVRPDADIANTWLIRDGVKMRIDLRPLLDGRATSQPALMAGDRIDIPSVGYFQEALARPSAITSPGFRIYISNLSIPSTSNAASAVAGEATRLPTGSRLSHALTSANCIGGTQMTNAGRNALLVSRNPITMELTSHAYRVYDVTRNANDTRNNPYLLPEDAIACFDSSVTVMRDLGRTLVDVLSPLEVLRDIQRGDLWND